MRTGAEEPESKGTLATSVYEQLRSDLLSGRLEPDSKLRVEWVVSQYGAGASPVREALNRLAAEGLLDRQEQRGFSEVPVSEADLDELCRTRCMLEEVALRESMAHADLAWEEGVVLALHRLSRISPRFDGKDALPNPEWEALHRKFHRAILANCRSRWLIGFCEQLADHAYRYRQISRSGLGVPRDILAEHRTLAEHAIKGDVEGAVEALKRHYQLTTDLCREWLRARSPEPSATVRPLRRRPMSRHKSS